MVENPKLLFNGEHLNVVDVGFVDGKMKYVICILNGKVEHFYDISKQDIWSGSGYLTDLKRNLSFDFNEANPVEIIKRKIEAYEEMICDMNYDFVEAFREAKKAPFADNGLFKRFEDIERARLMIEGMKEALKAIEDNA